MSPLTKGQQDKHGLSLEAGQRRSMRVLLSIPIEVSGKCADGEEFKEETRTLVVNAHGALIALAAAVATGQQVLLTNRSTHDARDCRIVHVGNPNGGKVQMGVEFTEPSAAFWHVDFPPDDWVVPEN
jgi:PilZ domain